MPYRTNLPRLMLVTDRRRIRGRELVPLVVQAARGGVGIVQLRERDLTDDEARAILHDLREELPATVLVVNGRARVARTLHVGLHLGAGCELPWATEARPRGLLLGRSAHDAVEARLGRDDGADYLILGTIYPTVSKPGHPGSGPDLVREIARSVDPLPVYAIGGVTVSRIPELIHAGAHGVAVCGELLSANDPRRVAEAMSLALQVAAGSGV